MPLRWSGRYNGTIMNVSIICHRARVALGSALLACTLAAPGHAESVSEPARTEVPDGAPQLAAEKVISSQSQTGVAKAAGNVIVEEERIQGRLANARVSVGGSRGYTVIDPAAGRVDRQADNGGKRVSPSLWELLRF